MDKVNDACDDDADDDVLHADYLFHNVNPCLEIESGVRCIYDDVATNTCVDITCDDVVSSEAQCIMFDEIALQRLGLNDRASMTKADIQYIEYCVWRDTKYSGRRKTVADGQDYESIGCSDYLIFEPGLFHHRCLPMFIQNVTQEN